MKLVNKNLLSWLKRNEDAYGKVISGMKYAYKQKLLPLEEHSFFHEFHSPKLNDHDFEANPTILFMGQYSTGKTTLIRHMLKTNFPGMRIGPEPTTDRFMAIMYDANEGTVPGHALVVDPTKPYGTLQKFGLQFLNKFESSTLPSPILKCITLVDTPGILSGEKQRVDRGYDFTGVLEWFAERVDRIILLFDAHKLDISDEFRRSIEALKGYDEKIRIILNKSDMVDQQSLMRVYGSLMWSLSKVISTPEVSRVYVGSFWDEPLKNTINSQLFEDEEHDLMEDIKSLPANSTSRKINDLSKRARLVKVHALIIDELRKEMPTFFNRDTKKAEIIANLNAIYVRIQDKRMISSGEFPELGKLQLKLTNFDFNRFRKLDRSLLDDVDEMLANDITKLVGLRSTEEVIKKSDGLKDGVFVNDASTPFGYKRGTGFDAGRGEKEWIVDSMRQDSDQIFDAFCSGSNEKLSRAVAKAELSKSKLPNTVLSRIYAMSDIDDDGLLDRDEFALANYIISLKLDGHDLPLELPSHLVPSIKREQA